MISPARILVYGRDPVLLETRRLVLQHSGFHTASALNLQAATELMAARNFDLLVLCHSLSVTDCEAALNVTHSRHPEIKNLILSTTYPGFLGNADDQTLSAFADPSTLIRTARQMIAPSAQNQ